MATVKFIVTRDSDGSEVREGDEIEDFRGETWLFIMATSSSKVYVRKKGVERNTRELFPSVFKLHIKVVPAE